jgi:hypothetical protein
VRVLLPDANPSGEVQPSPEAFDLSEAGVSKQVFVPAGCHGHEHSLQGQALALDLLGGVTVSRLHRVISLDEQFVQLGRRGQDLLHENERATWQGVFENRLDDALAMFDRREVNREHRKRQARLLERIIGAQVEVANIDEAVLIGPANLSRTAPSIAGLTSTPTKRLHAPNWRTNGASASPREQPRSTMDVCGFTNFAPSSKTISRITSYCGMDRASMLSKTSVTDPSNCQRARSIGSP